MRGMRVPLLSQNQKLRRQIRQERAERVAHLVASLDRAAYDQSVLQTKAAIDAINKRIRDSNQADAVDRQHRDMVRMFTS